MCWTSASFLCNWKWKSEISDICCWAALTIKQIDEVTGDVFVGSSYNWAGKHVFLGMKRKACSEAQDYVYMIRLYRTPYLTAKAWKDLAQNSNVQMQSFHGNKLFWSKKKLLVIQIGAMLLRQRHHVVILFFPLREQRFSNLTTLTHS